MAPVSMVSERFAHDDLAFVDEELGGTLARSADYGQKTGNLLAGNEPKRATFGAGQHGPVGIIFFPDLARIFQHEHCTWKHLLRYPFVQDVQFSNHVASSFGLRMRN